MAATDDEPLTDRPRRVRRDMLDISDDRAGPRDTERGARDPDSDEPQRVTGRDPGPRDGNRGPDREAGSRPARGYDKRRRDEDDERDDDREQPRRREAPRYLGKDDEERRDDDRRRDRDRDADEAGGGGRDRARARGSRRAQDEDDRSGRDESKGDAKPDDPRPKNDGDAKPDRDGQGDAKSDKPDDGKAQEQRSKRRPIVIVIAVAVALLLAAGGLYYYLSTRGKVDTDDAYTDGNVVNIAPQVSGQVLVLEVNDNQFVHKGDVLVRIDPRQFQFSAEQAQGTLEAARAQVANQALGVEIAKKNFPAGLQLAQANLEAAQASLVLAKANYDRQKSLPKQATTQQDVDSTASQFQQAQAQVDQAQARLVQAQPVQQNIGQSQEQGKQYVGQADQAQGQLDQANLNVEWATVRAPQDGWVTRRNVNAGNYVSAGTQIMSLVTTDIWITANYKETELNGMHPGQQVAIKVDAYPDLNLHGHVDSIQHGSGSRFSAFPAENATGNFVKIVQRVPVKIVIDSGLRGDEPLPLGVSVIPTVTLQ